MGPGGINCCVMDVTLNKFLIDRVFRHLEVYCADGHSIRMEVFPENPYHLFQYFPCPSCKRRVDGEQIVDAFIEVQKALEDTFNISILFYNGTLLFESLEFVGPTRGTKRQKLLTPEQIEHYK